MENVRHLPDRLTRLAAGIKADLANAAESDEAWVGYMVAAAVKIAEARAEIAKSPAINGRNLNGRFGDWWDEQGINMDKNDRAAMWHMGEAPEVMRDVLTNKTTLRSPRLIYQQHKEVFPTSGNNVGRKRSPDKPRAPHIPNNDTEMAKVKDWALDRFAEGKTATRDQAMKELGFREHTAQLGVAQATAVWEDRRTRPAEIDLATLPKTAQEKLAAAIRQAMRRAEIENTARRAQIDEEVRQRVLKEGAEYRADLAEMRTKAQKSEQWYQELINNHEAIFTEAQFMAILRCLHADSRDTVSVERLNTAFTLFNAKRVQLTGLK